MDNRLNSVPLSYRSGWCGRLAMLLYCTVFRAVIVPTTLAVLLLSWPAGGAAAGLDNAAGTAPRYQDLLTALPLPPQSAEFVPFTEYSPNRDHSDHGSCVEYIEKHPELIAKIREDLGCDEVRWRLDTMSKRFLYVPETRADLVATFIDYCYEVIDALMRRTGLVNPYRSISTQMVIAKPTPEPGGINAIIVRDLAREYQVRYQFSGSDERRININLAGRASIDEVGSYSSFLQYDEDTGAWRFLRDSHTIWKTVSANPYTVLMTPLEETLHICLRRATEQAILREIIARHGAASLPELNALVSGWMTVEEAVVGALVYRLAAEIVLPLFPGLPVDLVTRDLKTKAGFAKYRLLPRAIAVIGDRGIDAVISDYLQDPLEVRGYLETP